MKNKQCRTHRHSQGRHTLQILAYPVILCFEKWCPKQKCCCLPEVKHLLPQSFGLATPLAGPPMTMLRIKIDNHQYDTIVTIVFLLCHKTWNSKKMSIFCHFLICWLPQAWIIFLSCSTTYTKFWYCRWDLAAANTPPYITLMASVLTRALW